MDLNDKIVVVTGASSGIGAAIAKLFTKEGAKVAIVGRNENKLQNVTAECEKIGRKPLVIVADVSKDLDAKKIIDATISQFGKIDILVNNAGISGMSSIAAADALQVFDRVMNTNLRAAVYLTNLATPHLIETKGNIINISSIASTGAIANTFAYCTSKAAMDHFSRCVAIELAPKGVRCNTVNPGPVMTDIMLNSGFNDEFQVRIWEDMKKSTALDRISTSEEIADLVVFLASDKARGITGSSFVTDNGLLLKGFSGTNVIEKM